MATKVKFRARIDRNRIMAGPDWYGALTAHEGKDVWLTVEKFSPIRSGNIHRYYFGVVVPEVAEAMGEHDTNEVHEMLKWRHLKKSIGPGLFTVPSETTLTNKEMSEYIDKIILDAASGVFSGEPFPITPAERAGY